VKKQVQPLEEKAKHTTSTPLSPAKSNVEMSKFCPRAKTVEPAAPPVLYNYNECREYGKESPKGGCVQRREWKKKPVVLFSHPSEVLL
jgi:hypothetical protein